ncbi:MAG: ferritin-like domain-containing protein [Candidatus Acidiferrum sp.]
MNEQKQNESALTNLTLKKETSRRAFLHRAGIAGVVGAAGLGGLLTIGSPNAQGSNSFVRDHDDDDREEGKKRDRDILIAAEIAEALAVTTYTNIIDAAPFFTRLPSDDQGYLVAARQEEMSHYLLEQSVTDEPSPFKSFFYPKGMFQNAQTTLNVLVTLEDAFIAAYLVGVRHFSTPDLRVTAARIMGIESDHRTLARVLAADVAPQDGGPIQKVTGAQGVAENVDPPNNNGYERTLCWTNIQQALDALTPFADITAAKGAGFDVSKSFGFDPFTPVLPNPLGDFISFKDC